MSVYQALFAGVGGLVGAAAFSNWDLVGPKISEGMKSVVHYATAPAGASLPFPIFGNSGGGGIGRGMSANGGGGGGDAAAAAAAALRDQEAIAKISKEISSLANVLQARQRGGGSYVVNSSGVVVGSSSSSFSSIFWIFSPVGWIQFAAAHVKTIVVLSIVVGGIRYYMEFRDLTWKDLMFASRASLDDTTEIVRERAERIGATIDHAKTSLSHRMDHLKTRIQSELQTTHSQLEASIQETRREVNEAAEDVANLHASIFDVQEGIELVNYRSAATFKSIQLLCQVVAESLHPNSRLSQEIESFSHETFTLPASKKRQSLLLSSATTVANWITGRG